MCLYLRTLQNLLRTRFPRINATHSGYDCSNLKDKDIILELDDLLVTSLLALIFSLWATQGVLWAKPQKGFHLFFTSPQLQHEGYKHIANAPSRPHPRNINDRMDELDKSIIIFWGSQSGKAERLAKSLVRECTTRFNLPAMAADLELFDFYQLDKLSDGRLVGFVLSTYGEGGPTDNATGLYEYLRILKDKKQNQLLSRLNYFCFGLGSSRYQFYNGFVEFLDEVLALSGAQRIAPVGKMDEVDRSDHDWFHWKIGILKELTERFSSKEIAVNKWPLYDFVSLEDGRLSTKIVNHAAETSAINGQQQFLRVSRSMQLSRSNSVANWSKHRYLHVDLSARIGSQRIKYETGDYVAIWPINPNNEVSLLADLFGWDDRTLKDIVEIKPRKSGNDEDTTLSIPTPTSRAALLQYHLDICGPVSAEMLDFLASNSPNISAKKFLDHCRYDDDGRSEVSSQFLTCGQLMQRAAPGAKWHEDVFSGFLQIMARLRPRYFSIASSPLEDPDSLAITVGVVEIHIPQTGRPFVGLATGYIDQLHGKKNQYNIATTPGSPYNFDGPRCVLSDYKIFAHIIRSNFKLPADVQKPVLMIAAGSGIAPFRGFVQERLILARQGNLVGNMLLLYGCCSLGDNLYSDFWSDAESQGLLKVHIAFSRQPNGKKVYVQHKLLEHTEAIERLVHTKGTVYICGSINMANAVKSVLATLLGGSRAIERLIRLRHIQEDVWE